MDNVIIKYSDWFDDDGGFEKIKSEFKALGDDLIKEAKRIKDGVNIFDLSNADGIREYEERAEKLTESFKEYAEAKKNITKIENDYVKKQKASIKATELQSKNLAELEEKLAQYRLELKTTNAEEKLGVKTGKESAELRADLKLKIKAVTKEINAQQKEILESNKLSKKEEKLLKANIVLQKDRAETIEEIRERLSALRLVASQVNITTQEGRDAVAEYNREINELTDQLEENSDKFIQNKINVGNYEESIINALSSTGLFSTQIGVLDNAMNGLVSILTLNKEQLEEMEAALGNNTSAVKRFAVAFGKLNKVLKASIIGAVLVLVATIGSVFSQGRAGVIKTQKAMAVFNSTMRVVINTLAEFAGGVGKIFGALFNSFKNFGLFFEKVGLKIEKVMLQISNPLGGAKDEIAAIEKQIIDLDKQMDKNSAETSKKFEDGWNAITESVGSFTDKYNDAKNAVTTSFRGIEQSFAFADKIRKARLELVDLVAEYQLLELQAGDSTLSLNTQLDASRKSLEKNLEILKEENKINLLNLKLANAKARADAEAAGFYLSADPIRFAEELLALNQQLAVTENPLNDDFLQESQDALIQYKEGLNQRKIATEETAKQIREIERDLFEQNLDLLIDLIDTEKNLSEQQVNDIGKNFQDRVIEFNRFVGKFKDNAQRELDEFTKFAQKTGKDLDFEIKFNDDGSFDVLVNDTALSIDNIVELNKELQALGIAEIPINRFREFVTEVRNGVRDFKGINKELTLANIKVAELKDNLTVNDGELEGLRKIEEEIKAIQNGRDIGDLSQKERDSILKKMEELEKRKTEIQENAERERQKNRIDAIDKEIATVEQGSQRYYELLQERNDIERSMTETNIDKIQKQIADANAKAKEEYDKFSREVREIINAVLDKVVEVGQRQVEEQEERIEKQDEQLDEQRRRAELGLENTLAFEQRERAKQEAELIKRQKRLERLEKIKAVYTAYSNYANQGEQNPILKALRDFAILESITASFGDGGIVGVDGVRTNSNGITRGRSHNMRGGVLAFHEGGEGFFSRREVANMGEDNFRYIKHIASLGPIDTNFFTGQQREFATSMATVTMTDPKLVAEIREVKNAIVSKPDHALNVPEVVDGVLKFTETITKQNVVKRNHYKIKKPRL